MVATIKFDDGKEVTLSAETTERLKKELLKPKLKHGDIVYGGCLYSKRIILNYKGKLVGFNGTGDFDGCDLDKWAEQFGYKKIGNVFEEN